LRSLSLNEELTGLYNRRGSITLAENRQKLSTRQGGRAALIFGDVDDLKHINDSFGRREGDRALQRMAEVFRECFRESDIVARIGGDEFCATDRRLGVERDGDPRTAPPGARNAQSPH
jgi:diguanylate cyclase (GGDEF)-like protein